MRAGFGLTQRVNAYQPRVQPWGLDGGHASGTRMVDMDRGHGRWAWMRSEGARHISPGCNPGDATVGMDARHGRWGCIRDTDGGYATGTWVVGMDARPFWVWRRAGLGVVTWHHLAEALSPELTCFTP